MTLWISVFEEKPNINEEVLCYMKNGKTEVLRFNGEEFMELHLTDTFQSIYDDEPSPVQFWIRIEKPTQNQLDELKRLAIAKGTW